MWPTVEIRNWDEFESIVSSLRRNDPTDPANYFRGQSSVEWSLFPSIYRQFPSNFTSVNAAWVEVQALRQFQKRAHLTISPLVLPKSYKVLDWLALMQHHGAPTRLLDWTTSAYVAAYFAVQDRLEEDGAIWLFDSEVLYSGMKYIYDSEYKWIRLNPDQNQILAGEEIIYSEEVEWAALADNIDRNILFDYATLQKFRDIVFASDRLIAQQGTFTVSKAILGDHAVAIHEAIESVADQYLKHQVLYRKIVLPFKLKRRFLSKLNEMNINASSLFPGVDGLGRSIAGLMQSHIDWLLIS